MNRMGPSGHERQRGIAAVEFTIALPMLLFMMLAVSEVGRAFLQYMTLTHAARDAARYVTTKALLGSTGTVQIDGTLTTQARNLLVYGNTAGTGTALLPGLVAGNVIVRDAGAGNIAVLVSYAYQPMFGGGIPNLVGTGRVNTTFTLSAEVVMRAISS